MSAVDCPGCDGPGCEDCGCECHPRDFAIMGGRLPPRSGTSEAAIRAELERLVQESRSHERDRVQREVLAEREKAANQFETVSAPRRETSADIGRCADSNGIVLLSFSRDELEELIHKHAEGETDKLRAEVGRLRDLLERIAFRFHHEDCEGRPEGDDPDLETDETRDACTCCQVCLDTSEVARKALAKAAGPGGGK